MTGSTRAGLGKAICPSQRTPAIAEAAELASFCYEQSTEADANEQCG